MWCLHTPPSVVGSEDEAAHLSLCSRETELVFGLEAWSLTAEERVTKRLRTVVRWEDKRSMEDGGAG